VKVAKVLPHPRIRTSRILFAPSKGSIPPKSLRNAAPSTRQFGSVSVGAILHFRDYLQDNRSLLERHSADAIDDARHRCRRYTGLPGDISDRA
jgi:hypothetical protein